MQSNGTTLTQAFSQWARRPDDERKKSLIELHEAACQSRMQARTSTVTLSDMRAVVHAERIRLQSKTGATATLNNWSSSQLAARIKAPAAYLHTLPAHLAADCINVGLDRVKDDKRSRLLLNVNGDVTLRAITGTKYSRIWNSDITSRLLEFTQENPEWQPAPAAFDGSRGLYIGDRDMFAFLVNNNRRIFEQDPNGGLGRGFMVSNGECGDRSFWLMSFLYEYVCGNHRVWGATDVKEVRIRHIGSANAEAFAQLAVTIKAWADGSAKDDEQKIKTAKAYVLAQDKDKLLDRVFNLTGLPKRTLAAAYDVAVERESWYGNPHSAWGYSGGLTEVGRDQANADARMDIDRAAGKVMEVAF